MMKPLLHIEDLSIAFRTDEGEREAVRRISLDILPGEVHALVGESGSGKSVTAMSILRLLPMPPARQTSGSIRFDGDNLSTVSDDDLRAIRGHRIAMIFQEPMTALNPLHSIGRQLRESITIHQSLDATALETRVAELLELVGLGGLKDRLDAYPHQLSGGQRQRVMIAMALANDPELLIADEPTTALDVTIEAQIMRLLKELQEKLGMAMLFISHDLHLVRQIAGRVSVMSEGEIVETGDTDQLFSAPQHPYTQHLLSATLSEPCPIPKPEQSAEILSCAGLSVKYQIGSGWLPWHKTYFTALSSVSLEIARGETLGIVGESGSGKSTLGYALLRLLPSEGPILYLGTRLDHVRGEALRHLRSDLQIIFQDPYASLNPRRTVGQTVEEGVHVHTPELSAEERNGKVRALLEEVGLAAEMADRYPHEMSGGQRQRVCIARALILEPKLLVLDEPTSALDVTVQKQVLQLLHKLQRKHQLSYLFISHDLRVIRYMSHRVIVLQGGEIVETGETESLFASPQHPYTQHLLASAQDALKAPDQPIR